MKHFAIAFILVCSSVGLAEDLQAVIDTQQRNAQAFAGRVAGQAGVLQAIASDNSAAADATRSAIGAQVNAYNQMESDIAQEQEALNALKEANNWAQQCAANAPDESSKQGCYKVVQNLQNQYAGAFQKLAQANTLQTTYTAAANANPALAKQFFDSNRNIDNYVQQAEKNIEGVAAVDKAAAAQAQQALMTQAETAREALFKAFTAAAGIQTP